MEQIPVLAVVGPTASGKTALAVELALLFGGEVISADSMQIYRGLPIGTAQPSEEEKKGVPHHLLAFLDWQEPFSVADYVQRAGACIREIHARGKLPVLAGGTGLYLSSLLHHVSFEGEPRDPKLRDALERRAAEEGTEPLLRELALRDPETASRLSLRDGKRIVRALELTTLTGKTMQQLRDESRKEPSPYKACWIGLTYEDRSLLYDRINRRVDLMVQQGLLKEAQALFAFEGAATVKQAIGFKELFPWLKGDCSLEEALEMLRRETRRYAKRQLTWFRREKEIHWLSRDKMEEQALLQEAARIVANDLAIGYNK